MWLFVPDSPVATLFIALALATWKLGHPREWLIALAFFGNIILGGWTVWAHLAFWADFSYLHPAMRQFLIWSHAGMVLQAFVLHRIGEFSPGASPSRRRGTPSTRRSITSCPSAATSITRFSPPRARRRPFSARRR